YKSSKTKNILSIHLDRSGSSEGLLCRRKKVNISAKSTATNTVNSGANEAKLAPGQVGLDASRPDSMAADIAKIYNLLQKMSDEHDKKLDEIRATMASTEGKISELTRRLSNVESRLDFLEDTDKKLDDLENRSQRNNLRINGFPEGCEGRDPTAFLTKVLPEVLGVEFSDGLEIEWAHRSAAQPRPDGKPPRPFIVCFLRHTDKEKIRNAARDKGKVTWKDYHIMFFLDYSKLLCRQSWADVLSTAVCWLM
uniref:L1 transposable element RRM domain-containing protein n=1 Tax=Seriola dumerili TaxID=41447 RepID=A0A3B4U8Z8_SERDU